MRKAYTHQTPHPLMVSHLPSLMRAIKDRAVGEVVWDTPPPLMGHQDVTHAVHRYDGDDASGHGGAPCSWGGLMSGIVVSAWDCP